MLIFTVLIVELASWRVSQVFPTSYSWKRKWEDSRREEKIQKKRRRRKGTEDEREKQKQTTGNLPDITRQTNRVLIRRRTKMESSVS